MALRESWYKVGRTKEEGGKNSRPREREGGGREKRISKAEIGGL